MIRIDTPIAYSSPHLFGGRVTKWAHLWSDTSIEELHAFAQKIGLKRAWFQNKERLPHYDVTGARYKAALAAGAVITNLGRWLIEQRKARKGKR
jgi:hypothetical protein